MSTIQTVYRFTYTCNDKPFEEFYKTYAEAEYWRENIVSLASFADELDSLKYANVSKLCGVNIWDGVREAVAA